MQWIRNTKGKRNTPASTGPPYVTVISYVTQIKQHNTKNEGAEYTMKYHKMDI
jgi:hypothetical protein